MRIGIAGFSIEACSFSPVETQYEDFALQGGEALLSRIPNAGSYHDVEFVPLLKARSIPGGAVALSAYAAIKGEILRQVSDRGPWDGLYLDMHGAGYARGIEDLEGDLYLGLRNCVGPECFLGASYDLHGNISPRVFSIVDYISAYRTAPHVDAEETRTRTLSSMVQCMRNGVRPAKAWVPLPVILPGEVTSTGWDPGKRLYEELPELAARNGVIDTSLLMGYPWVDEPRSGASVLVYGYEDQVARDTARDLARRLWMARGEFAFGVPAFDADACVVKAMAEPRGPVFISDSGDNPTAGGVGDTTGVLKSLLEHKVGKAVFASIPDPAAVDAILHAGSGSKVTLSLGGKLDFVHSEPLDVVAHAEHISPGRDAAGLPNTMAVVRVGGCRIVVTERRTPFHRIHQFEDLGIDVSACGIVVVKIGYLEPELSAAARVAYLALSPGAVDQRITDLPYQRIHRPSFPMDRDAEADIEARIVSVRARHC